MTITLSPETEARLRRKAERTGRDVNALAESLISEAVADESEMELRAEYRRLMDRKRRQRLSASQATRLREVEQALDDLEEQNPAVQALYQRLAEDDNKLDRVLAILESRSPAAGTP